MGERQGPSFVIHWWLFRFDVVTRSYFAVT